MKATFRSEPKDYAEAMRRLSDGPEIGPERHMSRAERRARDRYMKNLTDRLVKKGTLRRA